MNLFTDEVQIFDMNLSSAGVMTVGIHLKEMDIAMIEAWITGLTQTGGILCYTFMAPLPFGSVFPSILLLQMCIHIVF
jgi:hypothetical protein